MPGSMRRVGRIPCLLALPFLLFAPVLEALDGDVEDVQLGAAPTVIASSEKHVRLIEAPRAPTLPVLGPPRLCTPPPPPPSWRPPSMYPVRCRPSLRAQAGTGDPDADPA